MSYQKPLAIKDLKFELEILDFPESCILLLNCRDAQIARAHLSKDFDCWRLGDVYVEDFKSVSIYRKILSRGFFRNYRSKGIGTILMKELINYAREQGARMIKGEMSGDVPRLASWYKSLGFTVIDGKAIQLTL